MNREEGCVPKLPQGNELKKAMADRGISIDGLQKNANYQPFEAAMQERLLDVMRDEREERALSNTEALTRFTATLSRRLGRLRLQAPH